MTRLLRPRALAAVVIALASSIAVTAPPARADQVGFSITGSTQMYTLGALLANRYTNDHPNLRIDVSPSSSAFGFDNTCIGAAQVGMSDVYIQDQQLREPGCDDMVAIPVAISATPVVYNLPGKDLNQRTSDGFTLQHPIKLTAQVVAGIYLCKVTHWNDPAIATLNRGVKLPSARIQAFNSSEPGGSGFVFDQWLAASDSRWNSQVGVGLQPAWPACSIGQASSGAMVQAIKTTPYSIGFAGFDYAISYGLQAAALKNASGFFVTPSLNGLSIAINKALQDGMPRDFRKPFVVVKDPDSTRHAFNPACFEFFVVHRNLLTRYPVTATRTAIKSFLLWTINSNGGQQFIEQIEFRKIGKAQAQELAHGFIPVPSALRDAIAQTVSSINI